MLRLDDFVISHGMEQFIELHAEPVSLHFLDCLINRPALTQPEDSQHRAGAIFAVNTVRVDGAVMPILQQAQELFDFGLCWSHKWTERDMEVIEASAAALLLHVISGAAFIAQCDYRSDAKLRKTLKDFVIGQRTSI